MVPAAGRLEDEVLGSFGADHVLAGVAPEAVRDEHRDGRIRLAREAPVVADARARSELDPEPVARLHLDATVVLAEGRLPAATAAHDCERGERRGEDDDDPAHPASRPDTVRARLPSGVRRALQPPERKTAFGTEH